MPILYRTQASASGGRNGRARSDDGILDVKLSTPKALGGPGEAATNPEQLFAAGYAACFDGSLAYLIGQKKLAGVDTSVSADVGIGPGDGKGFALDIEITAHIAGLPRDEAEALVHEAHEVCPYSNAVRGNVAVRLNVVT